MSVLLHSAPWLCSYKQCLLKPDNPNPNANGNRIPNLNNVPDANYMPLHYVNCCHNPLQQWGPPKLHSSPGWIPFLTPNIVKAVLTVSNYS